MDAGQLSNVLMVLQILSILGGGFYFLWRVDTKLVVLTTTQAGFISRLDKVDIKLENLSAVVIQLAKQEARMDAIDTRLQELANRVWSTEPHPPRLPPARKRDVAE
jgi:hypothetical protein